MDRPPLLNPDRHWRRTVEGIDPDLYSIVTTTNRTDSDITGPGRILGRWISKGGRQIERLAGVLATRMGFGPRAVGGKALFPTKHEFHRCPRAHDDLEHIIGSKTTYRVSSYSALGNEEQRCINLCMHCRAAFFTQVTQLGGFARAVKRLLAGCHAHDVATQLAAVEWLYLLACPHSLMRTYLVAHEAVITLHTLRNGLRLSISAPHRRLKRAIMSALEVIEDEHTSLAFEEMFVLDGTSETSTRQAAAMRVAEITRLRSGQIPLAAVAQIARKSWRYPQDYAPFAGLTASFPCRASITNVLGRMATAPPDSWECRHIQRFLVSLISWLCIGYTQRHMGHWVCSARDLWIPLLQLRSQTSGFKGSLKLVETMTPEHFRLVGLSLPPVPSSVDSALLWEGRYLFTEWHDHSRGPWYSRILCAPSCSTAMGSWKPVCSPGWRN